MAWTSRQPSRNSLLAKVHIAQKELGLDDATYRGVLVERYGVNSAAKLSIPQLVDLVDHFIARGFQAQSSKPRSEHQARGKLFIEIPDTDPNARQKRAILGMAFDLGWNLDGLNNRIERQFGVSHIRFLSDQASLQTLFADCRQRCINKGLDPDAQLRR